MNVGDPSASTLTYTHNFGSFVISPAGCPIIYSISIKDKNGATVPNPAVMGSFNDLIPDTSVDVIVGPSAVANYVNNSPYILTISATPEQNLASIKTDSIQIILLNTPVNCASVTVSTTQVSDKNYQIPSLQGVYPL